MDGIKVCWHCEFHVDYSHFPAIDWGAKECKDKNIVPAPMHRKINEQAASYELWRRRQSRTYHLSVYQSHFAEFANYPHNLPPDFFDFQANILQRRHQAFTS